MQEQPIETYMSARHLAAYAGVSPQMVASRLTSGDLRPVARLSNGTMLFSPKQAKILTRKYDLDVAYIQYPQL